MSIRTNPMKAVPVLLKRVKKARSKFMERGGDESFDSKLKKLTQELSNIEDVFMKVKKNQDALLDTLHEVDSHLRKLDRRRLDEDMDGICTRIRDCAHKLLPTEDFKSVSSSDDSSSSQQLSRPPHVNLMDLQEVMQDFILIGKCLAALLIFPVNAVINKRQAIYLWMGMEPWGEKEFEDVIDRLLELNVIVAYGNGKCPIVNKFKLNPRIHPYLGYILRMPSHLSILVLAQHKVTLRLRHEVQSKRVVFNVDARYLNFESQWWDKGSTSILRGLHLGRWQNSPSHHIEVMSQNFLKHLSNLEELRCLNLRGISRIFELPPSITEIKGLEILDLKACHNLETLPDDISSMTSLTHLNLSQCHLLDGMPNGIDKLTQLQVLKGFLLGNSDQTPCRISDIAKLSKLRLLSIRIKAEAVIKGREFESLQELSALEHLKISWGSSDIKLTDFQISFPSRLKKFHLECFPGLKIPEWLKPSKLKELKITGGNLESMNHDEDKNKSMNHDEDKNEWSIEIVRLKYLKHLEVDIDTLRNLFPLLRYAELRKISEQSYVEWEMDEALQFT